MRTAFPPKKADTLYLTEGGQETEIMYRFGYDFPEFAMFKLLDNAAALDAMRDMYRRYLDVAAQHGCVALMGGLDYRASPDWGAKLGLSLDALADIQHRAIGFLRDVSQPYRGQLPDILIAGIIGPRGDAYSLNRTITADEAEAYHGVQLATLKAANVDLVSAMTFNNAPEAVGVSRAAARVGLPIAVYFTLTSEHRLRSGPSLAEAIVATDAEAGEARPDFYGVNCSHPIEMLPALDDGAWMGRVRSFRPNAVMMDKLSLCKLGHLEEGDPAALGSLMGMLARRYPQVDIWGGCCGTWEKHLGHIAASVRQVRGLA